MPTARVLVYDGDCGFCTRTAEWAERRLPADTTVQPYQWLDLEPLGLTPEDGKRAAWWVDGRGRHRGHRAVGHALIAMGGLWRLPGGLILIPPISWIAAGVYALVARFRYKLPGGTPACRLPRS